MCPLRHSRLSPGWFFVVVGAAQMTQWAIKKHKQYRHEFPNYPRRKVIFPFLF